MTKCSLFLVWFLLCGVESSRPLHKSRNRDTASKLNFDAKCTVACQGDFCLPASVVCKRLQGKHKCCGGVEPEPSPLPFPIPQSYTPSPSSVPSFETFQKLCLNGVCIPNNIRLRYPLCRFDQPVLIGNGTLSVHQYCREINQRHRCCKRSPIFPTFTTPRTRPKPGKSQASQVEPFPDPAVIPWTRLNAPSECDILLGRPSHVNNIVHKITRDKRGRVIKHILESEVTIGPISPGSESGEENKTWGNNRWRHLIHFENTSPPYNPGVSTDFCKKRPNHYCCQIESTFSTTTTESSTTKVTSSHPPPIVNVSCSFFDQNLADCLAEPGCQINCAERTCQPKSALPSDCNSDCGSACQDMCACRKRGCEYSSVSGDCKPGKQKCGHRQFPAENECRRAGVYYSLGGEICQSLVSSGECQVQETVMAANFNGDAVIDSRGIPYQAGMDVKPESGGEWVQENRKVYPVTGALEQDKPLYEKTIHGKPLAQPPPILPPKCTAYAIPVCKDGIYELSWKTVDTWKFGGGRAFTVKFMGLEVFPSVDLWKQELRANGYLAFDFAVHFNVSWSVEDQTHWVKINGFPRVKLEDRRKALLEFCYGTCPTDDATWIAAAFSVVRFGNGEVSRHPGRDGLEVGDIKCQKWHHMPCQCKVDGCEYNQITKMCEAGNQVCNSGTDLTDMCKNAPKKLSDNQISEPYCRRDGVWYANAGVLCQSKSNLGKCIVEDTVLGDGFNGDDLVDSRGVEYSRQFLDTEENPPSWQLREVGQNGFGLCTKQANGHFVQGVPEIEMSMYESVMVAVPEEDEFGKCFIHRISLRNQRFADGQYEICLKFVEPEHEENRFRYFNVDFAGERILAEFEIRRYAEFCTGLDVIVPLEISDGGLTITMSGFPSKQISDEELQLQFCYGECYMDESYRDNKPIVSGVYLAKIKDPEGTLPIDIIYE